MMTFWKWGASAVIVLIIACSCLGQERQYEHQDSAVHNHHGNGRNARGRFKSPTDEMDDDRVLTREERRRQREERQLARSERSIPSGMKGGGKRRMVGEQGMTEDMKYPLRWWT
ncbi:hypothetical protein OTU49_013757 [Cherax quadricarinatus]|uniref:Secreted protein n=1 Tax=Cherax quadricarinatus TaxID=27406 RepID=A0AAW0VSJ5_CHEQU